MGRVDSEQSGGKTRRNVTDILAGLGETATVDIPDGETVTSLAVVAHTVSSDGKTHLRSGGTSRWTPEGRAEADRESADRLQRLRGERAR